MMPSMYQTNYCICYYIWQIYLLYLCLYNNIVYIYIILFMHIYLLFITYNELDKYFYNNYFVEKPWNLENNIYELFFQDR